EAGAAVGLVDMGRRGIQPGAAYNARFWRRLQADRVAERDFSCGAEAFQPGLRAKRVSRRPRSYQDKQPWSSSDWRVAARTSAPSTTSSLPTRDCAATAASSNASG